MCIVMVMVWCLNPCLRKIRSGIHLYQIESSLIHYIKRVRLLFIEVLITLFTEVSLTTLCDYYRKVTHASCYCIMITYYYAYKGLHSVDVYSNNYLYIGQRLILWIYNYYCMYNACIYYVHISSQ